MCGDVDEYINGGVDGGAGVAGEEDIVDGDMGGDVDRYINGGLDVDDVWWMMCGG